MNEWIRKIGEDSLKVAAAAAAGVVSAAIVFVAGMFTESHLVARGILEMTERDTIHAVAAADAMMSKGRIAAADVAPSVHH